MFRLRSLAVLVLLVASSLLTLKLMGFSQWIQAILVIGVELSLGVVLHEMIEGSARQDRDKRHRKGHQRAQPVSTRRRPTQTRREVNEQTSPQATYSSTCGLLLPLHSADLALIGFAVREALAHRAELNLLFLRKCSVLPMGPLGPPSLDEDEDAQHVIEEARRMAKRQGVPFKAVYATTANPAEAILEHAEERDADFVVMSAPRHGGWISKRFARDELRAVLNALPEHVSLLVHA